jgi:hypothetical protein
MYVSRWFTPAESQGMTDDFMAMIDRARDFYGSPIFFIDGYRTPEHNEEVRGKADSPHLTGEAFDVQAPADPFVREKLAWAFGRAGFTNVESCPKHFHVSNSLRVPPNAFYQGEDH